MLRRIVRKAEQLRYKTSPTMPNDWLPVPHYKQITDDWCLPACMRMVQAHLGRDLTEAEVARALCSYLTR